MTLAVLSMLPSLVLGWMCARLLTQAQAGPQRWIRWTAEIGLGIGLGAAISSTLWLIELWSVGGGRIWTLSTELVLIALAATRLRRVTIDATHPADGWVWMLRGSGLAILILFVLQFWTAAAAMPDGDWDALAIWNLRSKFLGGGPQTWHVAVSADLSSRSHPGYPLLTSAFIARSWTVAGSYSAYVPQLIALLFPLATGLVLFSMLAWQRREALGWVAMLMLFAASGFTSQAAMQYADLPLAFFLLAALAALRWSWMREWDSRLLALAGVFAGFAPWVKNEGIPFVILMAAVIILKARGRSLGFFAGAAPGVLLTAVFKTAIAHSQETMFPDSAAVALARLGDLSRWMQVASSFGRCIGELGVLFAHPVVLFILLIFCVGLAPFREILRTWWLMLPIAGLLAIDFAVYLITSADLTWHLGTSNMRLIPQVWPAIVYLFVLMLRERPSFQS